MIYYYYTFYYISNILIKTKYLMVVFFYLKRHPFIHKNEIDFVDAIQINITICNKLVLLYFETPIPTIYA